MNWTQNVLLLITVSELHSSCSVSNQGSQPGLEHVTVAQYESTIKGKIFCLPFFMEVACPFFERRTVYATVFNFPVAKGGVGGEDG